VDVVSALPEVARTNAQVNNRNQLLKSKVQHREAHRDLIRADDKDLSQFYEEAIAEIDCACLS